MKNTWGLAFFCLFMASRSFGEVLSLPENCFEKELSPCLIRINESLTLTSHASDLQLKGSANTIVKVLEFKSPFRIEILQGDLVVQSKSKKAISFKLNEVPFVSRKVFAQIQGRKISAYDTKSFILSEYEQSVNPEQETVISKSEFPAKLEMIQFVSKFYSQKKDLLLFLKTIEPAWQDEFETQTSHQTKVLERSVASVEEQQAELEKQKAREELKLKNVRKMFFYRTFYR